MMHCQQMHYWYSHDELLDRRIYSTTEVKGLKCPCDNTEGINNLAGLLLQDPSSRRGVIACSIGAYTANDSAPAQARILPCDIMNVYTNV